MMTGQFTPGPWYVEHTATCGLRVVHGEANEDGFRDDITPGAFNPTERGRANAALIAAAPALYEALKAVEWGGLADMVQGGYEAACPYCEVTNAHGAHFPACKVAAALSAARPAPTDGDK
jgi:hypothetical protein